MGMSLEKTAPDQAIAALERAAALVPNATGEDSPQAQIAEIALARGDKARAIKALDTLTSFDHSDVASARKLASLLDPKTERAAATALAGSSPWIRSTPAAHTTLGRMALTLRRFGGSGPRCSASPSPPGPSTRPAAHADLAESLFAPGSVTRPASRRWPHSRLRRPMLGRRTCC